MTGASRSVNVAFYGPLGSAIAREIELELSAGQNTLADLRQHLATLHPDQSELLCGPRTRWALDGEFANDSASLEGVTIAECLPPVSGG